MRSLSVSLFVLTLSLAPAAAYLHAQSPQRPQTYSATVTMPMGPGTTVKVARDGSKESVEQTVPPGKNGPGMHIRQIYDFATHKYWTMDLEGGSCVVSTYTSPNLPSMFDPIGGVEETRAGLAQSKAVALRSEAVNGIPTKVYELPVPEIKGKMRLFLEEKHDFAVKMVMVPANGKEQTQMEITSLSYDRPAATLFVPPQNCRVQAGESSVSGGHAETEVSAAAAGEKKLGTAKPAPATPAPKTAAPAAAAPVIEVRGAGVAPAHYTGPAPAVYQFEFSIDASGPVEAEWVLVSQADTAWESGKLVFEAAGTRNLIVPVKIGVGNGTHWEGSGHLEVVIGATRVSSVTVSISADCRAK